MTFPLQFAEKMAARIAGELTPFCDRIEIAGSIRRGRPMVGDIGLVVLPQPGRLEALKERCKQNAFTRTDGDLNLIKELKLPSKCAAGCQPADPDSRQAAGSTLQIDIFIARPARRDLFVEMTGNFGSVKHNIFLIDRAKSLGLVWNPYQGVYDPRFAARVDKSNCLASETEKEIFKALKLDFVPPERRVR